MPSSLFSGHSACSPDAPVESWPRCRWPQSSPGQPEPPRLEAIAALDLEASHSIPAFEEAVQLAARFLNAPVSWLSIVNATHETLKATHGLSVLGVGNGLAEQRQLPLEAGLGAYVLSGEEPVVIADLTRIPALAQSELVTTYGLVACCAVPLVTAQHQCIGMLAGLDVKPRAFSQRDVGFLEMAARWGMAEYERTMGAVSAPEPPSRTWQSSSDSIRLKLIGQLVQDLRNPLTTVLGMTTMLSREIYGPLTEKQREYTDIVHRSSQVLMAQVDEIVDLGATHPELTEPVPTTVDIMRLGQQVKTTLAPLAEPLAHSLELTVQPGEHLWVLDQGLVKQIIFHSLHSLIETASENSTIRMHAARKGQRLGLMFWVSNPWLGDGLPPTVLRLLQTFGVGSHPTAVDRRNGQAPEESPGRLLPPLRHGLGLVLSQALTQHHGGQLHLHGNAATGYRLIIYLPTLKTAGIPATMG